MRKYSKEIYERTSRPLRLFFLLFLSSTLFIGCGDSRDDFVVTGTGSGTPLVSVDVQPATATIQVGSTQQFTVEGTFSNGQTASANQFNGQITWQSSSEAVATIDENGEATGLTPGETTITATVVTPVVTLTDTATLTVTNQDPTVTLDETPLSYNRGSGQVDLFPTATFTDAQENLSSGTLTITYNGDNTGVDLTAPNTPDIGTVTDDDVDDEITVALNQNATPANIQTFLRAVQFSADNTAMFSSNSVDVTVTDGEGGTGSDSRDVNIQGENAQNITVAPSGGDFTSIQAAVNSVANQNGGEGSIIEVMAGDYTSDGTSNDGVIDISNDPDLAQLQLRGANFGVSAGINPGTRSDEAIVNAFEVDNEVIIDGFQVNGGPTSVNNTNDQGFGMLDESSGTIIRNNVIDYTGAGGNARGVLTITSADPTDLTISFNHFQGWTGAIFFQGTTGAVPVRTSGHMVEGNVAVMNTVGFSNDAVESTTYTDNVVMSNGAGEEAFGFLQAGTGVAFNNNDIADMVVNAYVANGVMNMTIDAENNWWGQASGPINDGSGDDQINRDGNDSDNVFDTDPFLTADPFPNQP